MINKRIIRFSALFVLIFLLIGLNAVSASDLNDDSLNLTDHLKSASVSNAVGAGPDANVESADDSGINAESVPDDSGYTIESNVVDGSNSNLNPNSEDSIELADSEKDNSKSKLGAGEKTVHTITEENYSKYFDSKGNLNKTLVKANDTINLSGNFSKKNFIIDIPITITSTESDAILKNSPIYYVNVSNEGFKYDAVISNLKIESNLPDISAVWLMGSDHIKILNNDIFTTGHNGYPISLDKFTTDSIVSNNKIRTIIPVNINSNAGSANQGDASDENSSDNSSWQHSGISLRDAHRNSIVNNEITVENSYGIYLCYGDGVSDNNTLANNTIRATSEQPSFWAGGIYITGSQNKVLNNTLIGLYRGVDAGGRPNNIIVGNKIYNLTGFDESLGYGGDYGIRSSEGSLIANNSLYNLDVNQAGILVASNSEVDGNYIQISTTGDSIRVGVPEKGSNSKVHDNIIDYITGAGISVYGDPEDVQIYNNLINSLSEIGASQGSGLGLGIYAVYQSRSKRPYDVSIYNNTIYTSNDYSINIAQLSTELYLCENNTFDKGIIYPMSVVYTPSYGERNVYEVTEKTYNTYFDSGGLKDIINDGDVLIFTGNFAPKGKLALNKSVSIIGSNATLFNTTIFINVPNCKVQNFTINNNGQTDDNCNLWGIYVFEADNEVITGNKITIWDKNTSYGIYLCDSRNNTVSDNQIYCEGKNLVFGLLNYEVYNTTFRNNKIKVVGTDEIYKYFDSICIDGQHSIGELTKTYGVIFDFSSDNKFLKNTINVTSNIKTYQKAYNPSVNILIGLYIYYESNRNIIDGNEIYVKGHDPFLYGMGISGDDTSNSVTQAWNNTLKNNYINVEADYFATGIILRHNSMNTKIKNNTLALYSLNYTYGLTLEISGGADIEENTFNLTGRAGIYATEGYSTWSNKISKNKYYVDGSFSEIALHASSGNNISDNDIYILSSQEFDPFIGPEHPDSVTLIPTGILLEKGSNGNIVSNNRIRTNGDAAITIRGSYGNTVSNNKLYSKKGGGNAAVDDNTGMNNIFGNTGSKFKDPSEKSDGNSNGNSNVPSNGNSSAYVKGGDEQNKGGSSQSGSSDSSGASSFGNIASNFFANAMSSANDGAGDVGADSMSDGSDLTVSELEEVASKSISSGVYVPIAALILVLIFCFSFLNSRNEDDEEE